MKIKYWTILCASLLILGILFGFLIEFITDKAISEEIIVGENFCRDGSDLIVLYNKLLAEQRGITQEDMLNITYAYLFNYSVWTTGGIQDVFISIPTKECCYAIYKNGLENIGEWYCKETGEELVR